MCAHGAVAARTPRNLPVTTSTCWLRCWSSGRGDLQEGLRLHARSERLGAFDAVLAATAGRANAAAIVSADTAFAEAGMRHVVPDATGVAGLLDG